MAIIAFVKISCILIVCHLPLVIARRGWDLNRTGGTSNFPSMDKDQDSSIKRAEWSETASTIDTRAKKNCLYQMQEVFWISIVICIKWILNWPRSWNAGSILLLNKKRGKRKLLLTFDCYFVPAWYHCTCWIIISTPCCWEKRSKKNIKEGKKLWWQTAFPLCYAEKVLGENGKCCGREREKRKKTTYRN